MIWLFDLGRNFLNVLNDLFYFMINPLNTTLGNFNIDLSIPYIGELSPVILLSSSLIMFLLISFILRLIHG